jgi:hypothetical protein
VKFITSHNICYVKFCVYKIALSRNCISFTTKILQNQTVPIVNNLTILMMSFIELLTISLPKEYIFNVLKVGVY